MRLRAWIFALAATAAASPLAAQSFFNASGLGLPTDPLDGRSRALGNVGIGLSDGALLPTDPGAAPPGNFDACSNSNRFGTSHDSDRGTLHPDGSMGSDVPADRGNCRCVAQPAGDRVGRGAGQR